MDDLERPTNETGTVFRDVLMLALLGFMCMIVLLLPHLNPPATKAEREVASPGSVIVEMRWPDDSKADVDLWVQAPGDVPVGYSNKGGLIFNLLRDDLGHKADALGLNYETTYSRGIPPGEYTVNAHLYRLSSSPLPIPVTIQVLVKANPKAAAVPLLTTTMELAFEGQEKTFLRFELDAAGKLRPGSVHNLNRPIRAWRSAP